MIRKRIAILARQLSLKHGELKQQEPLPSLCAMADSLFITIGSKGTSLPRELKKLEPPLKIGANGIAVNGINWSRGRYKQLGRQANGWVSEAKKDDPFFIYPLDQAVNDARVIHVPQIAWTYDGQPFTGEAFVPAQWKPGVPQPLYVAVRASGWEHGCVERDWNPHNGGQWVATLDLTQPSLLTNDPVDIEEEIKRLEDTYAEEPQTTRQAIIEARRGQGQFRQDVQRLWHGRCAVTECTVTAILQAGHIKPWRDACNRERLDPFNGLLLTPNLHLALDLGLVSFADDGTILLSRLLSSADAYALGLCSDMRLRRVFPANMPYLNHHRRLRGFQP